MTVREFLLKKTEAGELYVIRRSGYIVMTAWIDYEDSFAINNDIGKEIVRANTWGTISIRNHNGDIVNVDCHYIDI